MKRLSSVVLVIIILYPHVFQELLKYRFSRNEWRKLYQHKLILKKRTVKGAPWPEVKVYSLIDATPEESMAVYLAFPEQKNYIPGLVKSKPSKYISPTDIWIDFEVSLSWPLANSKFTTGNKIGKLNGGGYLLHWYPVTHTSAKECNGDIAFLPYHNRTLLIYRNFTFPNSSLAKFFKKRMYKSIKETINAIVKRIELVKKSGKTRMKRYIRNLNGALKGEYIFKGIHP